MDASTDHPTPTPPDDAPPDDTASTAAPPSTDPPTDAHSAFHIPQSAIAQVEAQAAAQLAAVYRELPGVVRDLIGGQTVADVQAALAAARRAYADIRAAVLADLSAGVPPAHGATAPPAPPASPFALIRAGVEQREP